MNSVGNKDHVEPNFLSAKEAAAIAGIPFAWIVSYRGVSARQNIQYFENGVRHKQLDLPIRVFFSYWTAAVVVSFVPLEAVREPHVREWFVTFTEVPLEEAKSRLDKWPDWPYDGRATHEAGTALREDPEMDPQKLLKKSRIALEKLGLKLLR